MPTHTRVGVYSFHFSMTLGILRKVQQSYQIQSYQYKESLDFGLKQT